MNVSQEQAAAALAEYRTHRNAYDARDWEIEKIYRQIAKGKIVISAYEAIRAAGVDQLGRPKLAIMRADQEVAHCQAWQSTQIEFQPLRYSRGKYLNFTIEWSNRGDTHHQTLRARLPRIPPQFRPPQSKLDQYHLLWEADWEELPRDPVLLKRIAEDAWIVLAAWDLTDVELSVLRSHRTR